MREFRSRVDTRNHSQGFSSVTERDRQQTRNERLHHREGRSTLIDMTVARRDVDRKRAQPAGRKARDEGLDFAVARRQRAWSRTSCVRRRGEQHAIGSSKVRPESVKLEVMFRRGHLLRLADVRAVTVDPGVDARLQFVERTVRGLDEVGRSGGPDGREVLLRVLRANESDMRPGRRQALYRHPASGSLERRDSGCDGSNRRRVPIDAHRLTRLLGEPMPHERIPLDHFQDGAQRGGLARRTCCAPGRSDLRVGSAVAWPSALRLAREYTSSARTRTVFPLTRSVAAAHG